MSLAVARRPGSRTRFRVETGLALLTLALLVTTLISREWIELLFGVDPDGGSGALEWAIVAALAVATAAFGLLARLEWRRLSAAPEGG
jgi:hypothetical protein